MYYRGEGGEQEAKRRQKPSPFSPQNVPLPIKYLVFDCGFSCILERKIYCPQQFVLPSILYYLYVYLMLLVMVMSSHLTTGGTLQGPWLQMGCGLSFRCTSLIKVAYFYLLSYIIVRLAKIKYNSSN